MNSILWDFFASFKKHCQSFILFEPIAKRAILMLLSINFLMISPNVQEFFLENLKGTIEASGASLIIILATLVPWYLGKKGEPTKSIS